MRNSVPLLTLLTVSALCMAGLPSGAQSPPHAKAFRDCANVCPEMVVIPPGSFTMGSPNSEAGRFNTEGPQHRVTIGYALAVGKYAVTRDEYAAFVTATRRPDPPGCQTLDTSGHWKPTQGTNWHNPGFAQTGRDPVVCISWEDAQAYIAWLSRKAGHAYRLLSEAEFEYAARAGTTTPRYAGSTDVELCKYYNHADLDYLARHPHDTEVNNTCHDGYAYTAPVGSFPANRFGLYDMLGNVLQWTGDCWNANYDGAPTNGSARLSGDCKKRVFRGGCWLDDGKYLRAAYRNASVADRLTHFGFRVARTT